MTTTFTNVQSVQAGIVFGGTGLDTIAGFQNQLRQQFNSGFTTTYPYGTAANQCNKLVDVILTAAASATTNLDLSSALTDLLNNASSSVSSIVALAFQLLSPTDDPVNGTLCSSITLGDAASHPWAAVLGSTGTYTLNNGATWFHADATASGLAVTSGSTSVLKIVNNDGSNAMALRLSLVCRG